MGFSSSRPAGGCGRKSSREAPFFLYFSKTFFIEIYFQYHILQFCTPTARQGGGRGPAAQQRGGRDLFVNLKKKYLRGSPWRELAAPLAGGRPPAAECQGGGSLPVVDNTIRCVLDMDTNKNH